MFVRAEEFQLSQNEDNPDCGTVAIWFNDIESVKEIGKAGKQAGRQAGRQADRQATDRWKDR
jgi:hypothetical protein